MIPLECMLSVKVAVGKLIRVGKVIKGSNPLKGCSQKCNPYDDCYSKFMLKYPHINDVCFNVLRYTIQLLNSSMQVL